MRRPPAPAAAPEAVADLVGGFGDGGLDATPPQVSAGRPAGVGLVGQDLAGPGPGPAAAAARDAEPVHERGEGEGVVTLPGAGDPGQRPAAGIGEQVDLGGQPAPGPAQRLPVLAGPGRRRRGGRRVLVIRWSPPCGPGRSAGSPPAAPGRCGRRLMPRPGGVLVRADHRRIRRDRPRLALRLITPGAQPVQDLLPGSVP